MLSSGIKLDVNIGAEQQLQTFQSDLNTYVEMVQSGASPEALQKLEKQLQASLGEKIPEFQQFLKKASQQALDAKQVYQSINLPGKNKIVQDRRHLFSGKVGQAIKNALSKLKDNRALQKANQNKVQEKARQQDKSPDIRMRQGKMVKNKTPSYENHLSDPMQRVQGNVEQKAAEVRVEKLLSAFEQLVVERFELGREVARQSADGKAHFKTKTVEQWRAFFARFMSRTVKRKVLLSEIREFLFRGAVQKGSNGVIIADAKLNSGRIEKFIRFSVFAEALANLKALLPGESFSKGALSGLTGEELIYLALAVSKAKANEYAKQPSQGKFIGGQIEARTAAELGIALEGQLQEKTKEMQRRKKGGGLFSLDGWDEGGEGQTENPGQFIPWWQWGRLSRARKTKTVNVLFYTALFIVATLGIAVLTMRLLGL